jgi:hypothetical protein
MAQVISRRALTVQDRAEPQARPCRICGGQSGTRTGLSSSSLVFPCHHPIGGPYRRHNCSR